MLPKLKFYSNCVNPYHRVRRSRIAVRADDIFRLFSSAVSADDFNLYLVDETGNTMRLFTADNDEYAHLSLESCPRATMITSVV